MLQIKNLSKSYGAKKAVSNLSFVVEDGDIMGGYIMYFIKKGNYNPVIGIAAVSCVPTTAKVAQKLVSKDNPDSFILGDALGANISGVITSAIITGIYITIIPYL